MNPFAEIQIVRGDKLFTLHWKRRHDPVTASILIAAGAGYSAYGSYQEGKAAQGLADYNAKLAERQAETAEQKSMFEQKKQAEAASRTASTMQAGLGASGVVTTAGSPLLIQATQAAQSEMDNLMIGYEGQLSASEARAQGASYKYQGKVAKMKGTNQAIGTLLTGFGTVAGMGGGGKLTGDEALWAKHQKNAAVFGVK